MEFSELRESAEAGLKMLPKTVVLVFPKKFKRPPRFPHGELLCENTDGKRVWMFKAEKILKWLDWAEMEVGIGGDP